MDVRPTSLLFLLFTCCRAKSQSIDDPCEDLVDPGPCQHYQIKWFWDSVDEECKEFHYGGCMGTRNKFNTKMACMKQCRYKTFNPVAIPELCLYPPDNGHCGDERDGQWWFHFNSDSGMCEKFFYYGCGGNDNRFYSLALCRKVCAERLSPQIACDNCDIRTSVCRANSKMNYTCECRVGYEKNAHGECVDIDECRRQSVACDRNAWCTNTIGSYDCTCMASYRGDGRTCSYVGLGRSTLDCSNCSEHATCLDGICQCKMGFHGDGFECNDVNECLRTPFVCDKNAECINRQGSFICACLPGYAGNGYNCTQSTTACLDKFDGSYQQTCGGENWREHYYFDHKQKSCVLFWYDGCPAKSRNIFSELSTCSNMCEETNVLSRAEICWDKFDHQYRNQCATGNWQQRFYFDHATLMCMPFWYDSCRSPSRNIFDDALTCKWLCETQPMYKSRACLEQFDHHYKDMCQGGRWRRYFYFDKQHKRCVAFWYDGCQGRNKNIFPDNKSCRETCEDPARKTAHKVWHENDRKKMVEKTGQVFKPNVTNICEIANPCQNNATCIYSWKKETYYCKCRGRYTGIHCTEKADYDPCEAGPCKNGATCQAKTEKGSTTYECHCSEGFAGDHCDQTPCASNPCKNNGTCRTTTGYEQFFCDCDLKFGGKRCEFITGEAATMIEKYGKSVDQLSSGRLEWIEDLREFSKRKRGNSSEVIDQPLNDEDYQVHLEKKLDREERQEKLKQEEKKRKEEEHEADMEARRRYEEERLGMGDPVVVSVDSVGVLGPSLAMLLSLSLL